MTEKERAEVPAAEKKTAGPTDKALTPENVKSTDAARAFEEDLARENFKKIRQNLAEQQEALIKLGGRSILDDEDAIPEKPVSRFAMLKALLKVVPPEARVDMISDFVFNKERLAERYEEEVKFQENLGSGWERKNDE